MRSTTPPRRFVVSRSKPSAPPLSNRPNLKSWLRPCLTGTTTQSNRKCMRRLAWLQRFTRQSPMDIENQYSVYGCTACLPTRRDSTQLNSLRLDSSRQICARRCEYFICIYPYIDQTTACTIATSLIHFQIDYCNSLLLNPPATQTNRLQLILNSTARAVTKTPKYHHIIAIPRSLHWLKINERIKYRFFSLTYKSLKTGQPSYIRSLLSLPSHRCTRFSSLIALSRPSLTSRRKIANRPRSYYHSAHILWNNLPYDLRHVTHHVTAPMYNSPVSDPSTSLFLKKFKIYLFHFSFPP